MWTDKHSTIRRHSLVSKEIGENIKPLGAHNDVTDTDSIVVPLKLFSPYSSWTWYIYEWDSDTGECFGLIEGFETEFGYIDLDELAELAISGVVPAIERDLYWTPKTIGEIKNQAA